MEISGKTKIGALFKVNPEALEAIVSISAHYKKLKNPVLRKIMASRVSISDAAKVGGVPLETFFKKLTPLGFKVKDEREEVFPEKPEVVKNIKHDVVLDVRADLNKGKDPFNLIMEAIKKLDINHTLLLVTSFVPAPLIKILEKRGLGVYCLEEEPDLVKTYISKKKSSSNDSIAHALKKESINSLQKIFEGKTTVIDVKSLEMPGPMLKVLEELKQLPEHHALHVLHKKVPLYLLPELEDLGYEVVLEENSIDDVELLIFKKT